MRLFGTPIRPAEPPAPTPDLYYGGGEVVCGDKVHAFYSSEPGAPCVCGARRYRGSTFASDESQTSFTPARTRATRDWINDRAKVAGEQIRAALAEFERETGATATGVRITHAHPIGLDPHLALAEVEWKL